MWVEDRMGLSWVPKGGDRMALSWFPERGDRMGSIWVPGVRGSPIIISCDLPLLSWFPCSVMAWCMGLSCVGQDQYWFLVVKEKAGL